MRLQRMQISALIVLALVVALALVPLPTLPYTTGFAPHWVTVLAAVLGAIFVVRPHPAGLLPAVLLLWSAGGVVLDGFRAFFAVTGIPAGDFARVDWPGMALRGLSLTGCTLLGALLLPRLRVPGGAWLGYSAFAIGFVYPMAKLYWSLGGTLLRPVGYAEGFPYGELIMLLIGAVGSLALVQRWGRWLPRRLVLAGGWTGAAMLTTMGAMSVFGTLSQMLGLTQGPVPLSDHAAVVTVGLVYGSWLLFGLAVGGATLSYQRATLR
ncbi:MULTISPECIES: hypothetical protein [Streptosporangium]|uniref:Uncharacterized protein n=1 Tax=Streptosporangium brasiliense TaxID=47480 RepID=A0ABT9RJM1_9ACTN|nr:hypothetical protein [Streptosporangium brasiliense]MDP9869492.1 hypothetical protein [Streptosporangium brasiliense]